jgi:hypothetical protein
VYRDRGFISKELMENHIKKELMIVTKIENREV